MIKLKPESSSFTESNEILVDVLSIRKDCERISKIINLTMIWHRLVRRALDEIPNHLSKVESSQAAQHWIELWNDPIWLLAKLATSGVTHVSTARLFPFFPLLFIYYPNFSFPGCNTGKLTVTMPLLLLTGHRRSELGFKPRSFWSSAVHQRSTDS